VLRTLGHAGIFELELIERDNGTFAALDLNPRPFGWMALALRAGANLPAIWCDWMLGRKSPRTSARPGVAYRWEDADLRHLVWQLRRGHLVAAASVLRPRGGVAHAYFELADPGPLPAAILQLARRRVRRPKTQT
jgi:predicted ATP-grasp superfamily ATP-dependent carboligase